MSDDVAQPLAVARSSRKAKTFAPHGPAYLAGWAGAAVAAKREVGVRCEGDSKVAAFATTANACAQTVGSLGIVSSAD